MVEVVAVVGLVGVVGWLAWQQERERRAWQEERRALLERCVAGLRVAAPAVGGEPVRQYGLDEDEWRVEQRRRGQQ